MIKINNLHATINEKQILKGLTLEINAGEVHAIMGPNGSGKSTLASILAGKDDYEITQGDIIFEGQNLLDMDPEIRAREGVFLAFQYPVEIPGVSNSSFLRTALNEVRNYRGLPQLDTREFLVMVKQKMELLEINPKMLQRSVNEGFSGGEKKRNEILQMAMLDPKFAVLDETDSGLDIDALRIVAHYQRLLDYIIPDFVHVLMDGRIVKTGGKDLALELEERGYDWIKEEISEFV
jgi:Fe-S cluster assembly ATP-binding protein